MARHVPQSATRHLADFKTADRIPYNSLRAVATALTEGSERNGEYAILKEFAVLEKTSNVPALDLPGLDVVSAAKGFGCTGALAKTKDEIKQAFSTALKADGPTLIAIPDRPLVAS